MESIDKRTCALSIVGMAFVWAPLHTSGHYPLSLVFTSQTAPVAEISAYHIVVCVTAVPHIVQDGFCRDSPLLIFEKLSQRGR